MKRDSTFSEESNLLSEPENEEKSCSLCLKLPKAIYCIFIVELCERFSFFGLRAILILYLTQHLMLKPNDSMSIYHMFISMSYFITIFGSFMADNFLGKFKTIVILTIVYMVGLTLMTLTAIPERNISGPIISLLMICFGIGGMRSCLGPFGGDQIPRKEKRLLENYFSMYYVTMNAGGILSKIFTPMLRANVACNGEKDCYPLAFGILAISLGIGFTILIICHRLFIHVPPSDNIYVRAICCFSTAIKNWFRHRNDKPKKRFLDNASPEYDYLFINDLRIICRILILYSSLPIYWGLFYQMGSRWVLQAAQMDGEILPNFIILPDQMPMLNVALVLVLIPIFNSFIYPITYKIARGTRPLGRITVGIFFTAMSFMVAFVLQMQIESKQAAPINAGYSRLYLVNVYPCNAELQSSNGPIIVAAAYSMSQSYVDVSSGNQGVQVAYKNCNSLNNTLSITQNVALIPNELNFLVVNVDSANKLSLQIIHAFLKSNRKGYPLVQMIASSTVFNNYSFIMQKVSGGDGIQQLVVTNNQLNFVTNWQTLSRPGRFIWSVMSSIAQPGVQNTWNRVLMTNGNQLTTIPFKISTSQVVIYYMALSSPDKDVIAIPLVINNGSTISIIWQFPQFLLLTIGEILVNITGLCFSYYQAPDGMKSLVTALWYLSVAFGNILVILIAQIHISDKQSWEFLTFSVLCLMSNVIFGIMALAYTNNKKINMEILMSKDDSEN